MKKLGFLVVIPTAIIAVGVWMAFIVIESRPSSGVDIVKISRIAQEAGRCWPDLSSGQYDPAYPFSIFDHNERLLYQSAPNATATLQEGIQKQDVMLPVHSQGNLVGLAVVSTFPLEIAIADRGRIALMVLSAFLLLAALGGLYAVYLDRRILSPFRKMQQFARQIACGNLDLPLQMDRQHLFGSFTEAFDLMRSELADARERERQADQSKKELVASLSHDIKTPLTAIKLTSELMLVTETNPITVQRVETIADKAEQIDCLITELFHSTLEELGKLPVILREESTRSIGEVVLQSDYQQMASVKALPECLVLVDLRRLEQVIGNILANSYKYAGTPIQITGEIVGHSLLLRFQDQGPGVDEEELPLLTGKFYRGRQVRSRNEGAGLGLYISASLMERMGGTLVCRGENGFTVELLFELA